MGHTEYAKRFPYSGTFELTGRCNLNCKMCYVHVDTKRITELGFSELSCEEWKRIADEAFDAGVFQLLLTGGEPMVRKDFIELYTYIAQKGFLLTLYTNATMMTDEIFEVLRQNPPHMIGVTIYGVSPETYGKVCGNPAAYGRMMEALPKLMSLPSGIELRTTITQDNLHEATAIEAFIKSFDRHITFNINHTIFKSGRNSIACPEEVRLTPRQNVAYYVQRFMNLCEDSIEHPEKLTAITTDLEKSQSSDPAAKEETLKGPLGCMAGWQSFTIAWNGRMIACQLVDAFSVDCRKQSLQDAWDSLEKELPVAVLPDYCKSCANVTSCGVCQASRLCETGSLTGKPEYFCQIAAQAGLLLNGRFKEGYMEEF